ncbi:hypothetical protein BOTU111921_10540 [Bordetella tumbae]|uniref:hypothetical protein n=1 Tax=Bordetella tumbae TaxID=1649139 RepID=UPI0039EFF5EB
MFDAKRSIFEIIYVLMFAIGIAGLVGWFLNIAKIFKIGFAVADWTTFEVARIIGVFLAPLGAVLGWI